MSSFGKKDFAPLPENDYLVRMINFEEKSTKNGKGQMITAAFQVVNGDYKNRLIFDSFLVEHSNPKAVEIGVSRLNKYLQSIGISGGLEELGNDRTQLENYLELPFVASVKIEKGSEYTDSNGAAKVSKDRNKITVFKAR